MALHMVIFGHGERIGGYNESYLVIFVGECCFSALSSRYLTNVEMYRNSMVENLIIGSINIVYIGNIVNISPDIGKYLRLMSYCVPKNLVSGIARALNLGTLTLI